MKSRYIMAFAAAALIFSGCQKNELSGGANEGVNDGWLKFRLSGLQLTKGTLINSEDEMLAAGVDEFTVQAWNADCRSFVTKQAVTYNTTESKWQTASPIAWTGTDSKTFFAYTNLPSSEATVTNVCTQSAKKQTLAYTLPLDARQQNDVMLGWYNGNGGGVQTADITFVHPLSSIILKQGEMEIDGIKKITVSGLYASGTVDVTYASGVDGVVPSYDWGETRTGSVISTLTPTGSDTYISVDAAGIIGTPFIVIPQDVAANQVKITVTASVAGADKNLVVNVPAGAFVAGQTHVFTLGYSNPDLLPGKFSVSANKYVQFSRGNLFCTDKGSGSYEFDFEQNQYDYRCRSGKANDNAVIGGSPTTTSTSTSGLFEWIPRTSTSADDGWGAFTRHTSAVAGNTTSDELDFGGVFPASDWTTLTSGEWQYLLDNHQHKIATVNGVKGLCIAPDDYSGTVLSEYSSETTPTWAEAEASGLVFLPYYGYYNPNGEGVDLIWTHEAGYWSSTSNKTAEANAKNWAQALKFIKNEITGAITFNLEGRWRIYGQNVRLVQKFNKPVEYVEIAGLKWATENLAITESGKKKWKGTGHVVGDYFQWAAHAGYCGNATDADKGLLVYTSFTSTMCGDGSDAFTFKSGKQFKKENTPYYSGSAFTKYTDAEHATLDRTGAYTGNNDDVVNIILGDGWRMPTSAEFVAMREATYWAWDATDKGYYVFKPGEGTAGSANATGTITYTDNKTKALLFFPAAAYGCDNYPTIVGEYGLYWSSSLKSDDSILAYDLYFHSTNITQDGGGRYSGLPVRPVHD